LHTNLQVIVYKKPLFAYKLTLGMSISIQSKPFEHKNQFKAYL
jgi:hypothetical protein